MFRQHGVMICGALTIPLAKPYKNRPPRLACSMHVSGASKNTPSASKTIPASPARARPSCVCGPSAGKSMRRSCWGWNFRQYTGAHQACRDFFDNSPTRASMASCALYAFNAQHNAVCHNHRLTDIKRTDTAGNFNRAHHILPVRIHFRFGQKPAQGYDLRQQIERIMVNPGPQNNPHMGQQRIIAALGLRQRALDHPKAAIIELELSNSVVARRQQ